MAEAGEGQVHAGNQQFLLGGPGEELLAGGHGLLLVAVELDGDLRAGELHRMGMDRVAQDQQALALRFDQVGGVAGGVADGWHGLDARSELGGAAEGFPLAGGLVGSGAGAGDLEEGLEILGRLGGVGFGEPEVAFGLVHAHFGIREERLAVGVEEAGHVVGVEVGQQHDVHLFRRVAGGADLLADEAEGRAESLGGAGVDENEFATDVDEVGVHRGLDLFAGNEAAGQKALDFGLAGAQQQVCGEVHVAVVKGGDFEIADGGAVVAGGLGFDGRGFGEGG